MQEHCVGAVGVEEDLSKDIISPSCTSVLHLHF